LEAQVGSRVNVQWWVFCPKYCKWILIEENHKCWFWNAVQASNCAMMGFISVCCFHDSLLQWVRRL